MGARTIRARLRADVSGGGPVVRDGPHGIGKDFPVSLLHPTSKRSGALGDQPGVAILGYMLLAQGERFGVVTEGELVFASPALIDLIGEAVKLALVGIKLLFAEERIVLREY